MVRKMGDKSQVNESCFEGGGKHEKKIELLNVFLFLGFKLILYQFLSVKHVSIEDLFTRYS